MNPIAAGLLGGLFGWGLHIAATPNQHPYSRVWGKAPIPLSPIFVVAGAAIAAAAPHLQHLTLAQRAAVYGLGATGLELASCAIDRQTFDTPAWSYSPKGSTQNLLGCIDIKHTLFWTALALAFEQIVTPSSARSSTSRA